MSKCLLNYYYSEFNDDALFVRSTYLFWSGKLLWKRERRDPEEKRFELEWISHSRDEGWISHSRDGEGRFPRNYKTIVKFVQYLFAFISAVIGGVCIYSPCFFIYC